MFKKILSSIVILTIIASCITLPTASASETFQIGDYIIIGQYNNEPIVWRYVLDDENGKLLVSDKIICMKNYGMEAQWVGSHIREWLNSDSMLGLYNPESGRYKNYGGESGFMSDENFTHKERNLIKTITQWTMVGSYSLSENDEKNFFTVVKEPGQMGGNSGTGSIPPVFYDFDDIPSIYYGAAMKTTDKVFLLDPMQAYEMKQNIGSVTTSLVGEDENSAYWLRSYEGATLTSYGYLYRWGSNFDIGVRPAFYLDESAIETMTGSGTENDPYILNGGRNDYNPNISQEITVKLNDEILSFDQDPIIEYDRVLVPFRAIFEALGAEVEWEGETQTVTAKKDDVTIKLVIKNHMMLVNSRIVPLDVAPRIVHNRTLVPVRAVFESLNATVDWDEDLRQVIIITE